MTMEEWNSFLDWLEEIKFLLPCNMLLSEARELHKQEVLNKTKENEKES